MPSPSDEKIPLLNIDGCDGNVLKFDGFFTTLYKKLGFKQLTFETAYQEIICDQFEVMSDKKILEHLTALAFYWQKQRSFGQNNLNAFLNFLKGRPLIRPKGNSRELIRPGEACSSGPQMFKTFKTHRLVPDEFFHNGTLMSFLEELGVKMKVGRSEVLEFARQIERGENINDKCLRELLDEAFSEFNTSEPGRKSYLQELGGIKFVPQIFTQLQTIMKPTSGMYASRKISKTMNMNSMSQVRSWYRFEDPLCPRHTA